MENVVTKRFLSTYELLKKTGKVKNQRDFCSKIEMPTSTFTEIRKGRSGVGLKNLLKLVNVFDVDCNLFFNKNHDFNQNDTLINKSKTNYSMDCKNCQYYQDMMRYRDDASWYKTEIEVLRKEISNLRQQVNPENKHRSA